MISVTRFFQVVDQSISIADSAGFGQILSEVFAI